MFLLVRKPLAAYEKVAKTNHSSTLPSPPRGPTDHGDEQARLDVLRMALAFSDHATADGVAKNLPVFGYTTVADLDPAAHRAGVVPSRGAHDSFPLCFEVVFRAIGFDQP